ncbi:MAG: class I SAM-dependent methyltransferase [Betaproteobacteria bacterium]
MPAIQERSISSVPVGTLTIPARPECEPMFPRSGAIAVRSVQGSRIIVADGASIQGGTPGGYENIMSDAHRSPAGDARPGKTMENPVSKIAYYTLGVRAWDAARRHPVARDSYAQHFVGDESRKIWERFKRFKQPNASNAACHRIISDLVQEQLTREPQIRVIVIGCGFDTRSFRLTGGHWVEVDEPAILAIKDAKMPASQAKNALVRVPMRFDVEFLEDRLSEFASSERTLVVIEGVLTYLSHDQVRELAASLEGLFPRHTLYCDLMCKSYFDRYEHALYQEIRKLGAHFPPMTEEPQKIFEHQGYRVAESFSIPLRGAELGSLKIRAFLVRYLLRDLREGYKIWRLEFNRR